MVDDGGGDGESVPTRMRSYGRAGIAMSRMHDGMLLCPVWHRPGRYQRRDVNVGGKQSTRLPALWQATRPRANRAAESCLGCRSSHEDRTTFRCPPDVRIT